MSVNYASIKVSQQARLYAKSIIDFYELPNTQKLGFWLGIPVACDHIALAIYADSLLGRVKISCANDVMEKMREEVPEYFLVIH